MSFLSPPPHTPTYQLLKSRGKSRSSLTPGQELDKSVWLGYRWPPAKADAGSKELPWAWHQVGLGPGTQHLLGSTADWRCIQSLLPVHPFWQLLLPPTESSTENECMWTEGHGYGEARTSSPFHGAVVTTEDKAGPELSRGRSQDPLPSQLTAGGTEDPGASHTKSHETLHCSQPFPLLLLLPREPPETTQPATLEEERSSFLLSHLQPPTSRRRCQNLGKAGDRCG